MAGAVTRSATRVRAPVVAFGMLALAGCTTVTTTTTAPTRAPLSSPSTGPELDLQLRPVLGVGNAGLGACPVTATVTPPATEPTSICSQDGKLIYSLDKAAVTGGHVSGLKVSAQQGSPVIQISFDPLGGAALSRVTAGSSLQQPPLSQLAIVSHGRVQSAPVVTEQIDGRVMIISGFADTAAAQAAIDFLES